MVVGKQVVVRREQWNYASNCHFQLRRQVGFLGGLAPVPAESRQAGMGRCGPACRPNRAAEQVLRSGRSVEFTPKLIA
jgi:hypothetical protein